MTTSDRLLLAIAKMLLNSDRVGVRDELEAAVEKIEKAQSKGTER